MNAFTGFWHFQLKPARYKHLYKSVRMKCFTACTKPLGSQNQAPQIRIMASDYARKRIDPPLMKKLQDEEPNVILELS